MILKLLVVEYLVENYLNSLRIEEIGRFATIEKVERWVDAFSSESGYYLIVLRVTNKAEFHRKKLMNDELYQYNLRDVWQRKINEYLNNSVFVHSIAIESLEQQLGRSLP